MRHPTPVTKESPTTTTLRSGRLFLPERSPSSSLISDVFVATVEVPGASRAPPAAPGIAPSRGRTFVSKNSRASSRAFISASLAASGGAPWTRSVLDLPCGDATPRVGPRASGSGSYRACSANA